MRWLLLSVLVLAAALLWWRLTPPRALSAEAFAGLYARSLPPAARPMAVYHLGHSLVGRDMPAMLAQLMGEGHRYHSQLGWGASLKQHWKAEVPGLAEENRPPAYRPAAEAIDSGDYDAVILTEMVELRDAIRYHDSAEYLARWSARARKARPDVRVYLYETWHRLDDPAGWLQRIDADLAALWEGGLLRQAMARDGVGVIHVIPAGQALAAAARAMEGGRLPGLSRRDELFARNADGAQDMIHLGDLGAYVVALTHFAVLTGESPVGLPHVLTRADGTPARAPSAAAVRVLQQVVWQVVSGYAPSGVADQEADG